MYGTALIDLYSTNYKESTSRKSNGSTDGNGNTTTIIKNTKSTIVKDKKPSVLRNLLFDNSSTQQNDNNPPYAYHTLSDYPYNELLVNISEEEEKQPIDEQQKQIQNGEKPINDKKRRNNAEYKSSSDGCKVKQLITQIPTSTSMQVIDNEIRLRTGSTSSQQHQIDFGKVIARFPMIYVGQKFLDKKYTLVMLPWLIAEFRREVLSLGTSSPSSGSNLSFNSSSSTSSNSFSLIHSPNKRERKRIWFEITDRCILGFDKQQSGFDQLSKSLTADSEKEAFSRMNVLNEGYIFLHKNNWICKIQPQAHEDGDLFSFAYLTRDFGCGFGQNNENKPYTLHVFECDDKQIMTDSIEIIKQVNPEIQRSEELGMSSADSLLPKNSSEQPSSGSLVENILGNSQQYEVMYCGKVRLAHKIASPSFIDETVDSWKQQAKATSSSNDKKTGDKTSIIPILSIDTEMVSNQTNDRAAGDNKLREEDKAQEEERTNRKLSVCSEEHPKTSASSDCLDQSTYQNKNHLHLPSNHSLITNTQSLDESSRESILSDLKEVKTQSSSQLSPKKKAQKTKPNLKNLNGLEDHLLTDNLDELGEIKRSSSAKSPTAGHTSKLNSSKLQMRSGARLRSVSGDTRMSKKVSLPLYGRPRTGSGGLTDFNRRYNSILQLRAQNRTMLFLIGRFEICLLSLDNQQILLNKSFNSVTHCSQGVNNPDHFGFICKEQKNLSSVYSNYKLNDTTSNYNFYLNNCASNSSSSSCLDLLDYDKQDPSPTKVSSSNLESASSKILSGDLSEQDGQYQYVGYIFRGENEKLVNEIMYSLKQAFRNVHHTIQQSKTKNNVFCDECPLRYFNQLCVDLQDESVEKAQCIILTKIGNLSANEQKEIMSGYEGVQVNSIKEQNEILMSLLKRFYEKKQLKHPNCKSEKPAHHQSHRTYSLDVFRQKAKKSLSTSFETITSLKVSLKNVHDDHLNNVSNTSSPNYKVDDKENNFNFNNQQQPSEQTYKQTTKQRSLPATSHTDQQEINPNKGLFNIFTKIGQNQNKSGNTSEENLGNSSSSSSSTMGLNHSNSLSQSRNDSIENNQNLSNQAHQQQDQPSSILKQPNKQAYKQRSLEKTIEFSTSATLFGDSDKQEISVNSDDEEKDKYDENKDEKFEEEEENLVSWRKQIFSSIQTNTRHFELSGSEMKSQTKNVTFDSGGMFEFKSGTRKRTRQELRELWRKAIHQQILLIKMEEENLLLQENQHEVEDKRLKLDYEDVITCSNVEQWTQILARCEEYAKHTSDDLVGNFDCFGNTQNFNLTKYSSFLNSAITPTEFADAIQNGCPKNRRGEIWCLLADIRQRNGVRPICSPAEASVDFNTNYRVLLQQLTSQQHAILVDLGRTFPKHPYFAQSLGSGQLFLYNLLKAYSLFDKEVGYCQGLSFVAGVLLMHMPEDDAFEMMKHLLFFLGLRKQYKPDMSALQMQFYQLTRLLYDHHRDIYEHFEKYDISPVLYAAPWFLTVFASQFSVSFVSRLFDFIFLFGLEAIFRVSLSLLAIHKQSLLNCNTFESIIYFIKNDLVETEASQLESMFNIAFALDITRQLLIYEIEYQVIQEEMQYQPLTITYDRLQTVKDQPNSDDLASTLNNKSKQPQSASKLTSSSSTTHLKANQPKVRKISCSAIQQPQSPYHHLKQRKISSIVTAGTSEANKIDLLTDNQSSEKIKELEKENKNLKNRNMEILDQLHVAQSSVYSLESSLDSYKSTVKLLERRVRALEDERDALLHMVSK